MGNWVQGSLVNAVELEGQINARMAAEKFFD